MYLGLSFLCIISIEYIIYRTVAIKFIKKIPKVFSLSCSNERSSTSILHYIKIIQKITMLYLLPLASDFYINNHLTWIICFSWNSLLCIVYALICLLAMIFFIFACSFIPIIIVTWLWKFECHVGSFLLHCVCGLCGGVGCFDNLFLRISWLLGLHLVVFQKQVLRILNLIHDSD